MPVPALPTAAYLTPLLTRLQTLAQPADIALAQQVAAAFASLDGYAPRPDQLAFAYLAAAEGRAALAGRPTPLALGMGCGEGKQEALAVALALTWQAAQALGQPAKLLFVTSTPELVAQMAASPALLACAAHLHRPPAPPRPRQ